MADPIDDKIAQELLSRVQNVTTGNGYEQTLSALRPTGTQRDVKPQNGRAVIFEIDREEDEEHAIPGEPNAVAYRLLMGVAVYVRPSESSSTAIDTLVNRAAADVQKAIRNSGTWHTFDDNAIHARMMAPIKFETEDGSHDGVLIPVEILFRVDEDDPYSAR